MISQTIQEAMNEQIKNELHSAYVYLSMAAYFESQNLPGFANWMQVQSREEVNHAMKFYTFINDRGGRVELRTIDQPPIEFASAEDAFKQALAHEEHISDTIHRLYDLALKESDYPAQVMLHWFIEEQVEEEQNVGQVLEMVKMAEGRPWSLLILDNQVGKRAE